MKSIKPGRGPSGLSFIGSVFGIIFGIFWTIMAASMGAFLLAAGAKGKRFALPNSEIMIHQPSGGAQGQVSDIKIHAENILKIKDKLNSILSANTGKPLEQIYNDTERDNFMTAEEACAYGLIDKVVSKRED